MTREALPCFTARADGIWARQNGPRQSSSTRTKSGSSNGPLRSTGCVSLPPARATGLSVREHQERTVANYVELDGSGPFIPVLQGWERDDYWQCVELYREAGIELRSMDLVGLGSVCRRQSTREIASLVHELADYGLRLHGFGMKRTGLARFGTRLVSADSMAWSYRARRDTPLPGCRHKQCQNCMAYALAWRAETIRLVEGRLDL